MSVETHTHASLTGFIWSICDLLRGPYKRNEYRKVILPLTVLRRFECTGAFRQRREQGHGHEHGRGHGQGQGMSLAALLEAPGALAENLRRYVEGFSPEVREIIARFGF